MIGFLKWWLLALKIIVIILVCLAVGIGLPIYLGIMGFWWTFGAVVLVNLSAFIAFMNWLDHSDGPKNRKTGVR